MQQLPRKHINGGQTIDNGRMTEGSALPELSRAEKENYTDNIRTSLGFTIRPRKALGTNADKPFFCTFIILTPPAVLTRATFYQESVIQCIYEIHFEFSYMQKSFRLSLYLNHSIP